MNAPRAEVSQVIDAHPDAVYRLVSDYRTGHPKILPKPYFSSLVVEEGGQGAGTVIRVEMAVMGAKQTLLMNVSEPQPGRVLKEEDPVAGVSTTFTITPVEESRRSHVQIATEWKPKAGFTGLMERLINPAVARHIYKKELDLLAAQMQSAT